MLFMLAFNTTRMEIHYQDNMYMTPYCYTFQTSQMLQICQLLKLIVGNIEPF